jgi:hypothetical protein
MTPQRSTHHLLIFLFIVISALVSCTDTADHQQGTREQKHHLNIPKAGIRSILEANTQKIIEGTDGSVIVTVGEIVRKKANISIRRGDKIIYEQVLTEKESMRFEYEGTGYTIQIHDIKKPIIGAGKAEISVTRSLED